MNKCVKCEEPCEVITITGSDTEECWGAPVERPWSEDASDCCGAEIYEDEDDANE